MGVSSSFFKREDSVVETASRFARDLMVQEVGSTKLQALGIKLVAADSPHTFLDDAHFKAD
jgi:hypothetical protein